MKTIIDVAHMATKDLEIALRIKADLAAAQKEVAEYGETLVDVGNDAEKASAGTKAWSNSNDQLAKSASALLRDLKAYDDALTSSSLSLEEISAQEQRLDRLMAQGAITMKEYEDAVTKLDKQEASLAKQKAEAAKAQEKVNRDLQKQQKEVEKQEAALAKAHATEEKELTKLVNTADKAGAELEKLAADAAKLEAALKAGKITQEDYTRAMAGIANRRRDIEATNTALGRLGFNSREARGELITLGRSLATGNFAGAASDVLRMSQRVDGAGAAFTRFAIPVAASASVVATYAAVTYSAWRETRELENTLALTGNAAGLTEESFNSLSRGIEESTQATIGQSKEITLALARTGKFSSDVIGSFGKAVAITQQLSGKAAADIVRDFESMEGGVAKWVAAHNKSMNFVTLEQYNYIRTLEEQGRVEEAQLAASEAYYDALAKGATKNIGFIEASLIKARKAGSDFLQTLKDLINNSDEAVIARNESFIANRAAMLQSKGIDPDADKTIIERRQQNQMLQQQLADARAEANRAADEARAQADAIAATDRVKALALRADRERQMQAELDQLKKDFETATLEGRNKGDADFSDANYKKLEAEIRKRYEVKPDKKDTQDAKAAEAYVKSLEQQAAAIGKTAAEVRLLSSAEQKLTEDQQARVNGALIQIQWEEDRQKLIKENQQLQEIEIQLLRAQGKEQEAQQLEFKNRYEKFLNELTDDNKEKGKKLVENLLDLQLLQSQLDKATAIMDKSLADMARQETSINTQRETGLISEYDARQKILELHRQTYAELEKQRPVWEQLAKQPGEVGKAAAESLAALNAQGERLLATTSLLEQTLKNGLESGLTDAILGLADGTKSFGDAVRSVGAAVAQALAEMAAQALAQQAVGALFGAAGGGGWLSAAASAFGYSDGGYTGAGGKYEAAGIVHKGEGVLSQEDISALGGPAGFYALRNALRGYADGGLVGVPAPAMPSPMAGNMSLADPAVDPGTTNTNSMTNRILNVVDPELVEDYLNGPNGDTVFINMVRRNTSIVQRIAGIKK